MINSIYEASALVTEKIREHGEQIKSIRSANNNRHSIVESSKIGRASCRERV